MLFGMALLTVKQSYMRETDHKSTTKYNKARYDDAIMSSMVSQITKLLTQAFIQAQIKENIKAPRHWPLWGEFTGDRWIPRTKGR